MPVSNCRPRSGRRGVRIVPLKPRVYVEQIGLLRPEQACECLSLYQLLIRGGFRRVDGCVEFIRLRLPVADHFIDPIERSVDALRREPQTQNNGAARGHVVLVLQAGLRSGLLRVRGFRLSIDNRSMECIFDVATGTRNAMKSLFVRLVVCKEKPAAGGCVEIPFANLVVEWEILQKVGVSVISQHADESVLVRTLGNDRRYASTLSPSPCIAEPKVWNQMQRGGLGSPVHGLDPYADILRRRLGILDEHIE